MTGWIGDIAKETKHNKNFRTVAFTGPYTQLTLMRLAPGEEIGREVHDEHDQCIRIEKGHARVELGPTKETIEETQDVEDGWLIVVPAGVWHNIVNTGDGNLKLWSLYSPPVHPTRAVHRTKDEARMIDLLAHAY